MTLYDHSPCLSALFFVSARAYMIWSSFTESARAPSSSIFVEKKAALLSRSLRAHTCSFAPFIRAAAYLARRHPPNGTFRHNRCEAQPPRKRSKHRCPSLAQFQVNFRFIECFDESKIDILFIWSEVKSRYAYDYCTLVCIRATFRDLTLCRACVAVCRSLSRTN